MLGQGGDAFGEDRDLDFGRTRVALAAAMLLDQRFFALGGNRHRVTPALLKVEPPDDPEAVGRGFHECDRTSVLNRECKPRLCWEPGKLLSMTEQLSLIGGDGEGRDVVPRRLKPNNRPIELPRLSGLAQKVQRNGLIEGERAGAGTP